MKLVTAALTMLLRHLASVLPPERRDWSEAVRAEAGHVPDGWPRLSWLAGGVWMVAGQLILLRRLVVLMAGLLVGGLIVWWSWHPGSTNPAIPAARFATGTVVLVLVGLPWLVGSWLGPVADNRPARIVRAAGYAMLYAVLVVLGWLSRFAGSRFDNFHAFDQRAWEADMRSGASVSAAVLIGLMGGYAATILVLTARRTAVAPRSLAVGAGLGGAGGLLGFALMPFGCPPQWIDGPWRDGFVVAFAMTAGVPLLAALVASSPEGRGRLRVGIVAGLCAGGAGGLVLSGFTIATMLLLPRQVPLRWDNPNPSVPHGTPYEIQMSVGDAAIWYQLALVAGPLLGLLLGVIGGAVMTDRSGPRAAAVRSGSLADVH